MLRDGSQSFVSDPHGFRQTLSLSGDAWAGHIKVSQAFARDLKYRGRHRLAGSRPIAARQINPGFDAGHRGCGFVELSVSAGETLTSAAIASISGRAKDTVTGKRHCPSDTRLLLRHLPEGIRGGDFLFPGERPGRYFRSQTAQRIMDRAVRVVGIQKHAAAHSFENGCDMRRIQTLLGHVPRETTSIYIRAASPAGEKSASSPLDRLSIILPCFAPDEVQGGPIAIALQTVARRRRTTIGSVTIEVRTDQQPIYLTGAQALEIRPGSVSLQILALMHWVARSGGQLQPGAIGSRNRG